MKKIIVVLMVLALSLTGCAQIKAMLTSAPVNFICSPTEAQKATATAMLAALDAAQAAGAIFVPVLAVVKASSVLKVIQAGGCFMVAELKAALETVDSANLEMARLQKGVKMAPAALPEYKPLRDLVK